MKKKLSTTELLPPKHKWIDKLNTHDALTFMLEDQFKAIKVIEKNINIIEIIVNTIVKKLESNDIGRLIYTGAGTSGRLGYQDGIELTPTFGWPKERLGFIIAGGEKALIGAVENAEDDITTPKKRILEMNVNNKDCVIGIAASGNTPFTISVIKEANKNNAVTVGIGNNLNGLIHKIGNYGILLDTGGEALAGSTRLKAGTSQKICLNLISTMVMARLGRVKNGEMNCLIATNNKLKNRIKRIKNST